MNDLVIALFAGLAFLLILSIYFLAIIDVHKRSFKTLSERGKWLTLIWVLPLLGSAFYLLLVKKGGIRN
jgi:hypothetical protein